MDKTYALFYDAQGKLVWNCRKDARYELNNGSKAIQKGAKRGELYVNGKLEDWAKYNVTH